MLQFRIDPIVCRCAVNHSLMSRFLYRNQAEHLSGIKNHTDIQLFLRLDSAADFFNILVFCNLQVPMKMDGWLAV